MLIAMVVGLLCCGIGRCDSGSLGGYRFNLNEPSGNSGPCVRLLSQTTPRVQARAGAGDKDGPDPCQVEPQLLARAAEAVKLWLSRIPANPATSPPRAID